MTNTNGDIYNMTHAHKIAIIQATALVGAIYSLFLFNFPTIIWVILVGYVIGVVGGPIGLHRYFSHRSFQVNSFWHYVLMFVSVIVGLGSPVAWVSVHLKHHAHSDTEKDAHSPKYKGRFKVFFGYFFDIYDVDLRYAVTYLRDPIHKFVHNYYFWFHGAYAAILLAINPLLIFPLYFWPVMFCILFCGITNVISHWNFFPEDNKIVAVLTGGEGMHKYHHDNPNEAVLPSPDFAGAIIKLIRKTS